MELLEVQVVNNIAPTLFVSELFGGRNEGDEEEGQAKARFIINVSSQEGQFSVESKHAVHVHTNMAKAALNMLTRSMAGSMAARNIFINSVDTGWVSRMRPGQPEDAGLLPPLSETDGATRVLDPVFEGYKVFGCGERPVHGVLLKNFEPINW